MKKFLSLASVGAMTYMSVMAAINWNSGSIENIAVGSTVTVSSNEANAANIVDGNNGTDWQANAATHDFTHDWVLINLGSEKSFTDIEISWEASHCKSYSVYVSDTAVPYTSSETEDGIKYNVIDATWLEAQQPVATRSNDTEAGYTDNIVFDTPLNGQYILIYADEYNNFGNTYGIRIFDIKIADIENRNEVTDLRLTCEGNAVAGGEGATITVTPINKAGEPLTIDAVSNIKLTCDNQAVTISEVENGTYTVSATEYGTFTITATAIADGKTISGSINLLVAFNWSAIENIATGKTICGRLKADTDAPNPPSNAVDGNLATYYQYNGEWGGGDSWLLVDLGDEYMVNAIGAYYSGPGASGRCIFGYATDATAIDEKIKNDGTDFVWNNTLPVNDGWTFSPELSRSADVVTTYTYNTPVVARYIAVRDADNPGGKPCVNEIYVSGTKRESPKADAIRLSLEKDGIVIGETNTVSVTVIDQYGDPFAANVEIGVTGAEYTDGVITGTAKGMVTVTAKADGITVEKKFYVADENDYCLDGSVITASEGAPADTAPVIDGGKVITSFGMDYQLAINEDAGAHEHWILINLAKPYNLDLIAVLWEGACPSDYDIYLGETEESLQMYYSMEDKEGMKDYSDRFSGKEMNDIQYIKVVTTGNATGYGLKLHDIKAYGTSNVQSVPDKIILTADNNDVATETAITLSATVYDQFGAEMQGQSIIYSCDDSNATIEGDIFTASVVGNYTVTATCGSASSEITINVVAKAADKLSAEALANTATLNDVTLDGTNIFADNEIQITEVPATLTFTFDETHSFSLINIRWEAACPSDYTVVATYADHSTATVLTVSDRKFIGGVNPVDKIVENTAYDRSLGNVGLANLKDIKTLTFNITAKDHDYPIRLLGMEAYTDGSIATSISDITVDANNIVDVYNLQGVKIRSNVSTDNALDGLPHGIYIVGGRKIMH